jgi:hypothetical protein
LMLLLYRGTFRVIFEIEPHTLYKYSRHLWMHIHFWQKYNKTVVDVASVTCASSA